MSRFPVTTRRAISKEVLAVGILELAGKAETWQEGVVF